ncbi:hypothetical protein EZV77_01215 [Burkholderia thailandensis]|nr:hypothetical protein A8H36_14370 [Burkholderia thailandensis]MDD1481764.1 hypothetical protein [Burkholderia thailandensis]PNE73894.1 hypothetical protein A8H37_18425 [Burkholderia thailandensis]PNE85937.1 hypothetical protein A8H30_17700 [Burkholderia thailandensis]TBW67205.1 hypothetical protein EZV77_01215 [Burkholderia thailandensis]
MRAVKSQAGGMRIRCAPHPKTASNEIVVRTSSTCGQSPRFPICSMNPSTWVCAIGAAFDPLCFKD